MNKKKTLLRIENPLTDEGLWYDADGKYQGLITRFPDALSGTFPMPFDEMYQDSGLNWFSAVDDYTQFAEWFSREDMIKLHGVGYDMYEFATSNYTMTKGHPIFLRDESVKTAIPFEKVLTLLK